MLDEALEIHGELHRVVVAPHAGFAVSGFRGVGAVVPAVGLVVDGVEQQAVMGGIGGEVGLAEERLRGDEAGFFVARGIGGVALCFQIAGEAEESLGGDGRGGAVDRFVGIEGIGRAVEVVAQLMEIRRALVPVGNAVGRGVGEEVVGGRMY